MKTLIELFDREPLENVLGMLMMNPEHVIFLGDKRIMREYRKESIRRFVAQRKLETKISLYHYRNNDYQDILSSFERIYQSHPGCAFEVTGGKEIPLLAAGAFCREKQIPAFYFDTRNNRFIHVFTGEPLNDIPSPKLTVRDILTIAGGSMMRHGHFQEPYYSEEMKTDILSVWDIYKRFRQKWGAQTTYFQQLTGEELSFRVPIHLQGKVAAECSLPILYALGERGILKDVSHQGKMVSFTFKNEYLRRFLNDAGIWLEFYTGLCAHQTEFFDDVQVSVVIDWDGSDRDPRDTTNEIDVLLVHDLTSVFVSCKTGVPSTHALNEIKLLAERFGGSFAKAVLVTSTPLSEIAPATYRRAADMGVSILEEEELFTKQFPQKLIDIAQNQFYMKKV